MDLIWKIILLFFRLLDWWNGVKINNQRKIIEIKYRYRFTNYTIFLPIDVTGYPIKARFKGKIVELPIQRGLKVYVNPGDLGVDEIFTDIPDD